MRVLLILSVILFAAIAGSANQLTDSDKSNVLDYIKAIRARVTPPPANMKAITWDDKLEQESLNWVSQCEAGLDPSLRGVRGQTYYIAGANKPVNYQQVLTAWEAEYVNYRGDDSNAYKASNYTQMVWWSTNRVGCAMAICPTLGEYWHCTWAPRGNFRGVKPHNSTCVPQLNPCGNVTCGRVSDGCQMVTCGAPCDTGCTSGACLGASAPPATEYVGCFIDSYLRDLSNMYFSHWAMTVDMCTTACGNGGYTYAALQAGNQCFCSNSYGQFGTASDSECYMPCYGNAYQQCGAWWRNSVYSLKPREDDPKFIASSCVMVAQYQGCFVDDANRDLQGSVYISNDMTVELCTQTCNQQGFAVAGLQFATQCFCGSSFGAYGQASESDCNVPCAGNGDQMCGGGWRNNIYKFVQQCIDDNPPIPAPTPIPTPMPVPVAPTPVAAPVASTPIPIPEPPPVNPPVSVPQDNKFSWTDRGYSSPVKYQNSCGSCWAFATTTSIETNWAIKNQKPPPVLSPQQVLDCSDGYSCSGGDMKNAWAFARSNGGLAYDSDYPYQNAKGSCRRGSSGLGALAGTVLITDKGRTTDPNLIYWVNQGVATAGILASNSFIAYKGGVYEPGSDCGGSLNHIITIVGYGTEYSTGKDYWIIRNSWGNWWGEGGYMRIRRTGNPCGMNSKVEFVYF